MSDITLYSYQQPFYDDIVAKLGEDVKSICAVLPTGGGKSVIIGKLANNLKGRTLVLTHRIEILIQNSAHIKNVGLLSADIDTLRFDNDVVIAMVQTLHARIKKYGIQYLGHFDNIILDEAHVLIFQKVFDKYEYKKMVAFTATPVTNEKKYISIDGVEYVEPFTLSELFDGIVQGADTQDLIDVGKLVQDYNIVLRLPDFDKLRESDSSPDGYTKQSLDEVYMNTASLDILNKAYNDYCKGKKTLIFNSSTKVNKFVYKHFKSLGLNVKMFDSVNKAEINPETGKKWTRDEVIEWFRNERDAILINTNVFTTGFDVTDVEVVIVNRATKSLSLWLQMVGRGARITDKIYKDKFTVIDLGQNIEEHGRWSERRDWEEYFYPQEKKRRKKADLLSTWACDNCGALNMTGLTACEFCGAEKSNVVITTSKKKAKEGELQHIEDMPPPRADMILNYTKAQGKDSTFAFKLLRQKLLELFINHRVSKDYYEERRVDFNNRVMEIFRPIYFAIINDKELTGKRRRLMTEYKKVIEQIEKYYEKRR